MALRYLRRFFRDESAATAVEYGLIAALIMVATIVMFERLGNDIGTIFFRVSNLMINKVQ